MLETEKIKLEIDKLKLKEKMAQIYLLKTQQESGQSGDEWEDVEEDSSE